MIINYLRLLLIGAVLLALPFACNFPRDPRNSLDSIMKNNSMQVGISHNPPWVVLKEEPSGLEVELLEAFAQELGCTIQWIPSTEKILADSLKKFKMQIAIAGFTKDVPWEKSVALTRPYVEVKKKKHVIICAPGENALVSKLELFLDSRKDFIKKYLQRELKHEDIISF